MAHLGFEAAEALEYAHQQGVVHRDIKPANLLLDVRGHLWITDFGLAHCQNDPRLTLTGDVVGTVRYMSPEQARAQRGLVDHRTDIYSLGATLYELLTFEPAFDGQDRQELLNQITFQEPRPPRRVRREVPADLETIVLKAMAKGIDERYATAQELADDLRRFLEHKPIRARRPMPWERLGKWARRHKRVVVAAVVLAVLAVLGLAVALGLIWAEQKRTAAALRQAEANYERAERNLGRSLQALDEIYMDVAEERILHDPRQEQVDRAFFQRALRFYEEFLRENGDNPAVRQETGKAYRRVGYIRYLLGQPDGAEEAYAKAVAHLQQLADDVPPEPDHRRQLAMAHAHRALLLEAAGRFREAEEDYGRARVIAEKLLADYPGVPEYASFAGGVLNGLALLRFERGEMAEARALLEQAVRHQRAAAAANPRDPVSREGLSRHLVFLGSVLPNLGQAGEGEKALREALDLDKQLLAEFGPVPRYRRNQVNGLWRLACLLLEAGRLGEAEQACRESLDGSAKLAAQYANVPGYHEAQSLGHGCLGSILERTARPKEAEQAFRQGIDLTKKLAEDSADLPRYQQQLAGGYFDLGRLLQSTGRTQEAEQAYRQALPLMKQVVTRWPDRPKYASAYGTALNNLAVLLQDRGQAEEARPLLDEAVRQQQAALQARPRWPPYRHQLGKHSLNLGRALWDSGKAAEAEQAYARALALREELVAEFPAMPDYQSELGAALNNWALRLRERKELAEARRLLERAVRHQLAAREANPRHPTYRHHLRFHYVNLAETLVQLGEHEPAARAAAALSGVDPDRWQEHYQAARFLARCLRLAENEQSLPEPRRRELAEQYGEQAVGLLRQAIDKGCKELDRLKNDPVLEPLRPRADFQKLFVK